MKRFTFCRFTLRMHFQPMIGLAVLFRLNSVAVAVGPFVAELELSV